MAAHIFHIDAEMAGPLVDNEGSGLENCLDGLVLAIEVIEGDEIPEQSVEILEDMEEPVHIVNAFRLCLQLKVRCHEAEKAFLPVLFQEKAYFHLSETLHGSTGLG